MSADNIAVCPRCNWKFAGTQIPNNTMREWVNYGIDSNGKFEISYEANCYECDFKMSYTGSKLVNFKED